MIKVLVEIPTFLDLQRFIKQSTPYSKRFYYTHVKYGKTGLNVIACTIDGIGLMLKGFMKDIHESNRNIEIQEKLWNKIHTLLEDNHFIECSEVTFI